MNTSRFPALLAATLLAAAAIAPGAAQAHGSMKPQHGGIVQMSGETLFEMVTEPKGVAIYISEEDEPLPASAYDARLIVTNAAGAKTSTPLAAGKGNRFFAAGLKAPAGTKVVVSLVDKNNGTKTFATFRK